jgi:drug/metabolite transporter (DMT)-like permease
MLVLRGLTSLVCWWLYYASFQALDLALASTLTFTTSLFVVVMAPFVLGERIGWTRGLTTLLGFIGVLLASGATGLQVEPGILLGLGSAFAAAILIFQNRVLARTEQTATIMFWIGLIATLGTAPAAALSWTALSLQDLTILVLAGTLATLGMLLTVEAYRFGEVSALAPFPYARILFALAAGYFLFSETIDGTKLLGAGVIVLCGLLAKERRRPALL